MEGFSTFAPEGYVSIVPILQQTQPAFRPAALWTSATPPGGKIWRAAHWLTPRSRVSRVSPIRVKFSPLLAAYLWRARRWLFSLDRCCPPIVSLVKRHDNAWKRETSSICEIYGRSCKRDDRAFNKWRSRRLTPTPIVLLSRVKLINLSCHFSWLPSWRRLIAPDAVVIFLGISA